MVMSWLDEVYRASENEVDIVLVYIPDISYGRKTSTPRSINWGLILPKISPMPQRTTVFEFKHGISSKEPFQQLLECGASLFPELFDFKLIAQSPKGKLPSVYFICEKLGGLIVKEAFANTIEVLRSWGHYLNAIRGLFLIGVPHVESEADRDRLAPAQRRTVRENVLSVDMLRKFRLSAKRFVNVVSDLGPGLFVVSAYGTMPTKGTLKHLFGKAPVGMPETFVRIGLPTQEITLGIDPNFQAIWDPDSFSLVHSALLLHLTKSVRNPSLQQPEAASQNIRPSISESQASKEPEDIHAESLFSSPTLASRGSTPLSQTSGLNSRDSSFAILTPPNSHLGSSPSSSASTGSLEPARITVKLPFRYPESCIDRERYFQGREKELSDVAAALSRSEREIVDTRSLRSYAISGLGGIGKTELAYQYVARHHTEYDVIFIIKADKADRLSHQYDNLAVKLGLLLKADKPSSEECREALKGWFKNPNGTGASTGTNERTSEESKIDMLEWLLVFDNVEEWATLSSYWPDKGRGSVLVTGRNHDVLPQLEPLGTTGNLELKDLPTTDAASLLKYYAGCGQDQPPDSDVEEAARVIVSRLEGLPLALMQVGSYIKQCKMSLPKFCKVHQKDSDLYDLYLERAPLQGYEHNLGSVWALESLSRGEASREAFAMLCLIAFLDPEGIQEDLLKPDPNRAQVPYYPSSEPEFHRCCKLLISASLVERGACDSDISVHRMVQKVVRAKVARDAVLSHRVFRDVLTRLTLEWPYIDRIYAIGTQGRIDRWPRCAELIPHVSALSQGYFELREKGSLSEPDLDLAELLYEASAYYIERSEHMEAARLLDLAASICDSAEGMADLTECQLRIFRGRIGVAFVTRNRDEYFQYAELSWKIETERCKQSGEASSRLAVANHQMGIAYNLNSLYSEAIPFLEESAKVRRSLPGFKKDWLFTPLYQLAHAYFHLGQDTKAAELLETAITDRIEVLNENDRFSMRTGALYYTLGDVKSHQGQLDQSLALHLKAYTHLKLTAGPTNLGTLHCEYKVAAHLARLRDYGTARTYLDHVLYYYRITHCARRYICRAALLYSECLRFEGKDPHGVLHEAVEIFNEFSPYDRRTVQSITQVDASSLVSFDYL